jgi:hypothetical protein
MFIDDRRRAHARKVKSEGGKRLLSECEILTFRANEEAKQEAK